MKLADLNILDQPLERLVSAEGTRFVVVGAVGTGRSTLASRLAEKIPESTIVKLPAEGLDRPLHLIAQLTSSNVHKMSRLLREDDDYQSRIMESVSSSKPLILVLPRRSNTFHDQESSEVEKRQSDALNILWNQYKGGLYFFVEDRGTAADLDQTYSLEIELEPVPVQAEGFLDESMWGPLARFAKRLKASGEMSGVTFSPIAVRLAVGLLALKVPVEKVLSLLNQRPHHTAIQRLAEEARFALESKSGRMAKVATGLSSCRFPFPSTFVDSLLEHHNVNPKRREFWSYWLRQCLGYGDSLTRISNVVKSAFDSHASPSEHLQVSNLYRALDGASKPEELRTPQVLPWLERIHHLAQADYSKSQKEWDELMQGCGSPREFLWERARSLSFQGHYTEAAGLYERCIQRDDTDHYSWHYLGFNRERSKLKDASVEEPYCKAVRLDPGNPRWNQRYIRFLIRRAKLEAAQEALRAAEGHFSAFNPLYRETHFYQREFYYKIISRYLKNGRWCEAIGLLENLPPFTRHDELFAPAWQFALDQKETDILQESVYPADYPMQQRWKLPPELKGPTQSWYPARVTEATASEVSLTLATTEAEIEQRSIYTRVMSAREWEEATRIPAVEAQGYWFLSSEPNGSLRIIRMDHQNSGIPYRERLFQRLRPKKRRP